MTEEVKKEEKALTPEELKEEKQEEDRLLATPDEAEVRSQIIEENELDEDTDSELIDKLTKKELKERKAFGKLVGQKRGWREKALKPKKDEKLKEEKKPKEPKEKKGLTEEELDVRLDERERKRDLEALEISDELKKEVESYAKLHKCSIKKAFESEYIQFRKKKEDKEAEEDGASIEDKRKTRTGKLKTKVKKEEFRAGTEKTPGSFDLSTEEGRKAHKKWKKEQGMDRDE